MEEECSEYSDECRTPHSECDNTEGSSNREEKFESGKTAKSAWRERGVQLHYHQPCRVQSRVEDKDTLLFWFRILIVSECIHKYSYIWSIDVGHLQCQKLYGSFYGKFSSIFPTSILHSLFSEFHLQFKRIYNLSNWLTLIYNKLFHRWK